MCNSRIGALCSGLLLFLAFAGPMPSAAQPGAVLPNHSTADSSRLDTQQSSSLLPALPPGPNSLAAAIRGATRLDSASFVPPVGLIQDYLNGPHTTSADRAVVGVEITNRSKAGATETRTCSGLLIRCDGFFLLPPAFTTLAMSGGTEAIEQTVRVTLHPGDAQEQQATAYIRHYIVNGIDTTVMKLQGVHAPAARLLLPSALKQGDDVQIVWTVWNADTRRFGAVQRRAAKIGAPFKGSEGSGKSSGWRAGEIPFAEPVEGVPSGAAVMGPEGMAIGVMPGSSSRHDRFLSFSILERITNCVAASLTTDSEFARLQTKGEEVLDDPNRIEESASQQDGKDTANLAPAAGKEETKPVSPANDMIEIPGGPVRLPELFQRDQRDMAGEVIACVPAFKIDRYKVSNREYYQFWRSIPEKDRARTEVRTALYPLAWADTEPPFPAEMEDYPVLGVPMSGARAYANSNGKRLPTSYEWTRAVFGPFGDAALPAWLAEYKQDRDQAWARIYNAHLEHSTALYNAERTRLPNLNSAVNNQQPLPVGIPILLPMDRFIEDCRWSQQVITSEVKALCEKWKDPLYIVKRGARDFDVSPFGVRDAMLNGNEKIQFSPEPKLLPDTDEPPGPPQAVAWVMASATRGAMMLNNAGGPWPISFRSPFEEDVPPLLLSRRLVASSALVHGDRGEFAPSDNEAYVELRARVHEAMMMVLPMKLNTVRPIWHDVIASSYWGEGIVTLPVRLNPDSLNVKHERMHASHPSYWEPTTFTHKLPKRLHWEPAAGLFDFENFLLSSVPYEENERIRPIRPDEAEVLYRGKYFYEAPFYSLWQGHSPFLRREMGRDWAKDPPQHVGVWPSAGATLTQPPDYFLMPNGFRCAR